MTPAQRRIRERTTWLVLFGFATIAACADNLNGPNECVFAYAVEPGSIILNVGDSATVRAIPDASCGAPQTVTWSVEDNTKATVRSTGSLNAVVRGVAAGTTIVNAENGDKAGFAVLQVR